MGQLDGCAAIVTGSSKGLGKRIAERFAGEGAAVVVNSRSIDRADAVAAEINSTNGTAHAVEADVTDPTAVTELVDAAFDEFGSLDIMVNNAGLNVLSEAIEFEPEDWRHVIDVNLTGTFFGAQAAARRMIESDTAGQIINISSIFGSSGIQERSAYGASKGGINNLTRCLAVEWAEHDICVNALAPGYLWTDATAKAMEATDYDEAAIRRRTPLGRFGTLSEIATCATFLATGGHFMTGQVLHADGGWNVFSWGHKSDATMFE